jgi:hypothetical protein
MSELTVIPALMLKTLKKHMHMCENNPSKNIFQYTFFSYFFLIDFWIRSGNVECNCHQIRILLYITQEVTQYNGSKTRAGSDTAEPEGTILRSEVN